jgi:hypothetical protein
MRPAQRFEKISEIAVHRSQKLIPLKVSAIAKMQIFANVFERTATAFPCFSPVRSETTDEVLQPTFGALREDR